MKKIILFLIGSFAFLACEDTITLDLDNTEPILVIEGLITNELKDHAVRVTRSNGFYDTNDIAPVTDAVVTVSDGTQTFAYAYDAGSTEERAGKYFPTAPFAGEVGKVYNLTVVVNGKTYTATDELFPVTEIDSLTVSLNQDEFEDPEEKDYFYEILFYAREPQETEDFYLFKFYRNDSLIYDEETDIYFADDKLLGEEINGIPGASYYKLGDVAEVEMYSLSNAGFVYYNDLINLLNNDGGMFGSPPVNPRTNIKGGALGFFQCSSLRSASILIEE